MRNVPQHISSNESCVSERIWVSMDMGMSAISSTEKFLQTTKNLLIPHWDEKVVILLVVPPCFHASCNPNSIKLAALSVPEKRARAPLTQVKRVLN
jgi:hypothetical protein